MFDNLKKLFSPVESLDSGEARDFITRHKKALTRCSTFGSRGSMKKTTSPGLL